MYGVPDEGVAEKYRKGAVREVPVIMEFKYAAENILQDFEESSKLFSEMDLIVCWDLDEGRLARSSVVVEALEWKFHFTPTYSSWLNRVEIWFSIISRQCIRRGVFQSVRDLIAKIMRYIREYNKNQIPFQWTYRDPARRITVSI